MKYILYYLLLGIAIDIVFIIIIKICNYITDGETVISLDSIFRDTMLLITTMPLLYPAWIILFFLLFLFAIAEFIGEIQKTKIIQNIKNKLF